MRYSSGNWAARRSPSTHGRSLCAHSNARHKWRLAASVVKRPIINPGEDWVQVSSSSDTGTSCRTGPGTSTREKWWAGCAGSQPISIRALQQCVQQLRRGGRQWSTITVAVTEWLWLSLYFCYCALIDCRVQRIILHLSGFMESHAEIPLDVVNRAVNMYWLYWGILRLRYRNLTLNETWPVWFWIN